MKFLWIIIPEVLMSAAVFIFLPWLFGRSQKEEAESGVVSTTKYPKRVVVFSVAYLIVTVLLFLIASILLCVLEDNLPASSLIAFIGSAIFLIAIPFILVLTVFRTYEVIRGDGILVRRLFKEKLVRYSEMASYQYVLDQLTVYDKEHKLIFCVENGRVGIQALLTRLDAEGVVREEKTN